MTSTTTPSTPVKRTIRRTFLHSNVDAVHTPHSPSDSRSTTTYAPATTPTSTPSSAPTSQTRSAQKTIRRTRFHSDVDVVHAPHSESLLLSTAPIIRPLVRLAPCPRTPQEPQHSTRTPNPTKTKSRTKTETKNPEKIKNFIDRIPNGGGPPAYQPPPPFTPNPDDTLLTRGGISSERAWEACVDGNADSTNLHARAQGNGNAHSHRSGNGGNHDTNPTSLEPMPRTQAKGMNARVFKWLGGQNN